jgi:hypothetical protein
MLDWMSAYLADLPESDRATLRDALNRTWQSASADAELQEELGRLGHALLHDPRWHVVLRDVYREAVTENPRAKEFLQKEVLDSPEFRAQFFELLDLLAPTLREVAALSLFDEHGATRPEVVHVLRSVALNRDLAWITLKTGSDGARPLVPNSVVPGTRGGGAK